MKIEFMGRATRISSGGHNIIYLFPDEVFELIRWAKDHEFQLLEKARELQHIEEQKARRKKNDD